MNRHSVALLSLACIGWMAGCSSPPPQVLGTLEYDRIALPAPAAERITAIDVREGQRVAQGAVLVTLETTRAQAATQAAQAQTDARQAELVNLEQGARTEQIKQAQAQLGAAQAQERDATAYLNRLEPLGRQKLVAAADVDRARAAASSAQAATKAAQAALQDLKDGARQAQIAQGEASVRAAQAQATVQQVTQDKLIVTAPRSGVIDSIPYKLGDQASVGAPLAVMLVGDAPYARVYIPETLRTQVKVGSRLDVVVEGRAHALQGTVRAIRNEPSFTPYYALSGENAARLSYLAEIQLGDDARDLPAGLPVRARWSSSP